MIFAGAFGSSRCLAEEVIWQIGQRDNATLEFNDDWDFAQHGDPNFVVGKSDPKKDWSGFHPASSNEASGHRVHPFTITFQLNGRPRGVFYLTVDVLFKAPGIPEYQVEVNGKVGRFYFHPSLTYDIGDPETAWDVTFSNQRLRIALAAADFHPGENKIVLACEGDLSHAIVRVADPSTEASGIYYDALQLSNDEAASLPAAPPELSATPTIFYRTHGQSLAEIVVLGVAAPYKFQHGSLSLKVSGGTYACHLPASYDFGENRCAVEIPDLGAPANGSLTARLGAKSHSVEVSLTPAKKWKLFLVPLIHLDMGYTDYRPDAYEVHNRNIDRVIETMETHPDYKFNPDGSFIFQDYWEHRGDAWRERCLKLMREKRLALPAQLFTINTGLASQEELNHFFYFSAAFSKQYGIPLTYANQTDVPAHSWAFPSYLQAIGLKYLVVSSNPWRGPIIPYGRLNEKSPFWWEGPDGAKVLTWYSRQYSQLEDLFTSQMSIAAGVNSLPIFLQSYSTPAYGPDAVMVYGTQSDNRPFLPAEVEFPGRWNKEFAYPQITTAIIPDFFHYVEEHFASSLPTLRGDGGAWWEEMAAADARFAAMARHAKEDVLAAEEAASLAAIVNNDFRFPLDRDRDIWQNLLLYTEHTWGAPRSWIEPESDQARTLLGDKESFSRQAALGVDNLLRRGLSQLDDRIYTQRPTVVVFNPLSWKRQGVVEVDLPRGEGLIDAKTGQAVPLEIVRRDPDEEYDRLRFRVDEVPAAGYRCYTISASGSASPPAELPVADTIENKFYRVKVDPGRGGIASIYDKQLGRELVDGSSPYALDQYVYAGYGHDGASLIRQRTEFNTSLLQFSLALPHPNLVLSAAAQGKIVSVQKTPWGTLLKMSSSAAHTPAIETEIRLFDDERKVELINTVHKDVVRAPEAVYFAFPFAGQQPAIRYESQNTWIDPMKDQLPGANKEWFVGQHWVSVTSPGASIGLTLNEAPLFTLGDVNRGLWPRTLNLQNGTVYSYLMDNYDGDDERPFQGGSFTFHYAITSAAEFQPGPLARFGKEEDDPIEVSVVTPADKQVWGPEPLDGQEAGFIEIDQKEIILSDWKGAEDGRGQILGFYNTSDQSVQAHVAFPKFQFERAFQCNAVEADQKEIEPQGGGLEITLQPHEIRTLRVVGLKLKQ